ncbi:MAG: hypothetical protein LBG91_03440 [Treponema sp.]|nr:hypothetical protein [Treponema sp.]
MKKIFITVIMFLFLLVSVFHLTAQSTGTQSTSTQSTGTTAASDAISFPQWAKDMRRWDIIAFGSFPFAMFTATFFTDMVRWNDANGLDFSEDSRRYAPWPLKSAGAVEMSSKEFERTLIIAAGLSVAVAFTDLIIVQIKRQKERRRIESMPAGSAIINKIPYQHIEEDASRSDSSQTDEFEDPFINGAQTGEEPDIPDKL